MVKKECVVCANLYKKGCAQSFHSIPKDPKVRLSWCKALLIDFPIDVLHTLYVCSNHFEENDYCYVGPFENHKTKTLKKTAVPKVSSEHKQSVNQLINRLRHGVYEKKDERSCEAQESKEISNEELIIINNEEIKTEYDTSEAELDPLSILEIPSVNLVHDKEQGTSNVVINDTTGLVRDTSNNLEVVKVACRPEQKSCLFMGLPVGSTQSSNPENPQMASFQNMDINEASFVSPFTSTTNIPLILSSNKNINQNTSISLKTQQNSFRMNTETSCNDQQVFQTDIKQNRDAWKGEIVNSSSMEQLHISSDILTTAGSHFLSMDNPTTVVCERLNNSSCSQKDAEIIIPKASKRKLNSAKLNQDMGCSGSKKQEGNEKFTSCTKEIENIINVHSDDKHETEELKPAIKCCITGCQSSLCTEYNNIDFYEFPAKNECLVFIDTPSGKEKIDRRDAWQRVVGKKATKNLRVCSSHFKNEDYLFRGIPFLNSDTFFCLGVSNSRTGVLKQSAVPSLQL